MQLKDSRHFARRHLVLCRRRAVVLPRVHLLPLPDARLQVLPHERRRGARARADPAGGGAPGRALRGAALGGAAPAYAARAGRTCRGEAGGGCDVARRALLSALGGACEAAASLTQEAGTRARTRGARCADCCSSVYSAATLRHERQTATQGAGEAACTAWWSEWCVALRWRMVARQRSSTRALRALAANDAEAELGSFGRQPLSHEQRDVCTSASVTVLRVLLRCPPTAAVQRCIARGQAHHR
jgi:hypothetical protein